MNLLLLGAALLAGCDAQRVAKLEEGVASEADVRQQFGDPVTITEKADGSKIMEYPRQPEGTTNYLIVIGADGKMSSLRQLLTPDNFARVQPGQSTDEVRAILGKPARTQRYALRPDEDHWEWRFLDQSKRQVFTVSFGADRKVTGTAIGDDPRDTQPGG